MKKSLLALAVLGAYVGVASAQSSVTLFGIVDLNGRYVKNDGQAKRLSMAQDGINSSRLGFRGIEDLGGGFRAGFWLEAGLSPDGGAVGSATTPSGVSQVKLFGRRSTVSLIGARVGELRLGRDYTPTFWNQTIFDAFGTNGLGSSTNVAQNSTSVGVRQDNAIGYFLPSNMGGFYGQLMVAAGESGLSLDRGGRNISGRLGFAAGPFDIAGSYGVQRYSFAQGINLPGDEQNTWNIGGSWDFGFFKVLGYYQVDEYERGREEERASVSALFRMGQGEIRVGYDLDKYDNGSFTTDVEQFKATYQYNLSKRTALYGTGSYFKNKDGTAIGLPGGYGTPGSNGKSKGFELGVRHIF